ncbi:MAG: type II toxin-antitoxin system RelE/ParE family toxin [Spirochaetes bacterium]|nr:type II toxin-antitoxin system RelE/ParE family toxin [Spirochaetota bacterium]
MARVIWSDTALADIFEIGEHIARDSVIMADIVTAAILNAGDALKNFPLRGRKIPELQREEAREIFYKSYRIMYEIDREQIEILAVIHGARDFKGL